MRKSRLEKQLYYGLAILVVLFVIVGLTKALRGSGREAEETAKTEEAGAKTVRESREEESAPAEQKQAENPDIRVLLMTNGYRHTVHPEVVLQASSDLVLTWGEKKETYEKEKELVIRPDDARLKKGAVRIQAKKGKITVKSLKRGDGAPSYAGIIELRGTAEGIAMINELPLESYLCGVVPSEMPASYELEALKAQAVCARTFAYRQMKKYRYPEYQAHVNDSTDDQVYGNSKPAKSASRAVRETMGEVVRYGEKIASTYYYSTSCGRTTSVAAWGTKETKGNAYLRSVEVKGDDGDYEKALPWYRWEASVPVKVMSELIGLHTGTDVGTLKSITVTDTGPGGVALKIVAKGKKGSVTVKTENKIRRALGGGSYTIRLQDGTETKSRELLPSAFFTIKKSKGNFEIRGGGFGHGIGMSQNGANEMAKCGKVYQEILTFFYPGTKVGL